MLGVALTLGCAGIKAQSASGPAFRVPPGCEKNQSGLYALEQNSSYRYLGEDDGGTLTLYVRRAQEDGGTSPTGDPGNTLVLLQRSPSGFSGQTLSVQLNGRQVPCPIALPTVITACGAKGLSLKTADRTEVDEACRTPPAGPTASWMTEELLRVR
jgi:hypothetical protein